MCPAGRCHNLQAGKALCSAPRSRDEAATRDRPEQRECLRGASPLRAPCRPGRQLCSGRRGRDSCGQAPRPPRERLGRVWFGYNPGPAGGLRMGQLGLFVGFCGSGRWPGGGGGGRPQDGLFHTLLLLAGSGDRSRRNFCLCAQAPAGLPHGKNALASPWYRASRAEPWGTRSRCVAGRDAVTFKATPDVP